MIPKIVTKKNLTKMDYLFSKNIFSKYENTKKNKKKMKKIVFDAFILI